VRKYDAFKNGENRARSAKRENEPSVNSKDVSFIGTKAYFWDPEMAGATVQCLCGANTASPGEMQDRGQPSLKRHDDYSIRKPKGVWRNSERFPHWREVRYQCRNHDAVKAEATAAKLQALSEADYYYLGLPHRQRGSTPLRQTARTSNPAVPRAARAVPAAPAVRAVAIVRVPLLLRPRLGNVASHTLRQWSMTSKQMQSTKRA
jgi:hypothetical protein